MKNQRVAIYARISTSHGQQSPEMQLQALREYCHARHLEIYKEYVDEGISGSKDSRPALNEMMDEAKKRKFDTVLVWKFDRFARSTKHLITALEEFKALGIDFISYSEAVDTSTPMGRAVFTIVSAIAELERSLIVERVKAGLKVAKKKGKKLGRPCKSYPHKQFEELLKNGVSVHAAAKQLKIPLASAYRLRSSIEK
jgi:DNA invertase Pin-like site-specific DNA recombinase